MKYSIWRILFYMFISISFLGFVLVTGISFFFYRFSVEEAIKDKMILMRVLSNTVSGPAWTVKQLAYPGTIENIFRGVSEITGTRFVRLIDSETNVIEKSHDSKETGMKIENIPFFGRDVVVREGVFNDELINEFSIKSRDGSNIWMGVSFKNIKENILRIAIILGAIMTALFLIVASAIFFIFQRFIVKPFALLTDAFSRLNKKDYRARLENVSIIEIQKVFQSFNEMAKEMEEFQGKLIVVYEAERKTRLELETLDKSKNQFLLTTQHHLRTPLTIIKGHLEQLLKSEPESLNPRMKQSLEKIDCSIDRLTKLVNEFLNVSQLEIGKGIFNLQLTQLKPILDDIVADLNPEIAKKKINVSFADNPMAWPDVLIDQTRFREALYILIDNAIKYNKEGGNIVFSSELKDYYLDKTKKVFQLHIKDDGIGITDAEFSKLFNKYFSRGEEAEKAHVFGKGIGLVLAKNIIEAHNGRIWAESEGRSKGSKFIIELEISE